MRENVFELNVCECVDLNAKQHYFMDIRIKDSFTKIEKIWFHYKKQNDVNIKQSEMKI